MHRYCIWFVTPDDPATRRIEVSLASPICNHQVLDRLETSIAADCRLSSILITHWQRFEDEPVDLRAA